MKRKVFVLGLLATALLGFLLIWIGDARSTSGPRVVLIGIDGGSWDILRHMAAQNRVPNLQRLMERGSTGYLDSVNWRTKTERKIGYFSPVVWSSIATGKLPNKHGVEDFKLPVPSSLQFRMGYPEENGPANPELAFPFNIHDRMSVVLSARAPKQLDHVDLQVFFNDRLLGACVLTPEFKPCRLTIEPDRMRWENNRLVFRYGQSRNFGLNVIGADVEYIRIYGAEGAELYDYAPSRDTALFGDGWITEPSREFALASSYHIRTRTLWEILSSFHKRVAVVGWWATWPAYKINGYLVTSHVGLHGERRKQKGDNNFLKTLPDLTYPDGLIDEIIPMYTPKEQMIPEFGRRFFEMGKCGCIGSRQEKIVLERFWQDDFFSEIGQYLLDRKGKFDLFAIYFRGTDTMSHQFIGYSEDEQLVQQECGGKPGCDLDRIHNALFNYYSFVDSQIGEIIKRSDRNTIFFVITDHGEFAIGRQGTHKNNGFVISAGPGVRKINYRHASVLDITPTILYLLDLPVGQDMDGKVLTEGFDRRLLLEKPLNYVDSYDRLIPGHSQKVIVDQKLEEQDTEELKALGYIN